ncbi:ribonuclease III [soil metagenome]
MAASTTAPYSEKAILDECQAAIGYQFTRPELLRAALTHTSGANTRAASNERLEFLGDSVLGLVTCELLFEKYPQFQEGDMTKVKSCVVSRKTCAQFSIEIGLGDFLFLGKGMNDIPSNMQADVFEALVAAIFLDGGWEVAKEFVLRFVETEIDKVVADSVGNNSKSQFQQVAQKELGGTPRYVLLDEQGPEHNRCFKVIAQVNEHQFPPAWGRTKKEAELKAALNALAAIEETEISYPSN